MLSETKHLVLGRRGMKASVLGSAFVKKKISERDKKVFSSVVEYGFLTNFVPDK